MEGKNMEANSINLGNATLSYIDKGEGKTLLFLHGFCGSSLYWENIIPKLSENYRVIVPDLPGHGDSVFFTDIHSIEDFAELIKNFLEELKIDKVTMFGHSLGGYITLAFAEKFHERLNGFSLVHSTAFPDSAEVKQGRERNIEKVGQEGIKALIDGLVPKLFSPDHVTKEYVETAKKIGYSTSPHGAISTLQAMKDRPDRNYVINETSLPVLLAAGENDQIIPSDKTFSVNKENVKHSLIKNSGHMSMYENPVDLLREIKGFLENI